MTVGLPFAFGMGSLELEGPLVLTSGMGEVETAAGLFHELSSCWKVMVAVVAGEGKMGLRVS